MRLWFELLRRTASELVEGDCLDVASQVAYNFLLSLFPALMMLLALASFFHLRQWTGEAEDLIALFVTSEIVSLIRTEMTRLSELKSGGILTMGAAAALWSSSSALVSVIQSVNDAYGLSERRPWWKIRLVAAGLTGALGAFTLASIAVLSAGPVLARWLGDRTGNGSAFELLWTVVKWPAAFTMLSLAFSLVYYFAPDAETSWRWIAPGAAFGAALWVAASFGFRLYMANFSSYQVYGAVGAVITMLLWLYVSSLALLLGAELNAKVKQAFDQAAIVKQAAAGPRSQPIRPLESPVQENGAT